MDANLAHVLDLRDLTEANEAFPPVHENMGYDPYDNPGTHADVQDEAD